MSLPKYTILLSVIASLTASSVSSAAQATDNINEILNDNRRYTGLRLTVPFGQPGKSREWRNQRDFAPRLEFGTTMNLSSLQARQSGPVRQFTPANNFIPIGTLRFGDQGRVLQADFLGRAVFTDPVYGPRLNLDDETDDKEGTDTLVWIGLGVLATGALVLGLNQLCHATHCTASSGD